MSIRNVLSLVGDFLNGRLKGSQAARKPHLGNHILGAAYAAASNRFYLLLLRRV